MKRVVVHIDRLALRGVRAEDREIVAAALRQALTRRLAEPGAAQLLAACGSIARHNAGRLALAPATEPSGLGERAGERIARAITLGLSGGPGR